MRPRLAGLWRSPEFLKLWAGQTVSVFGSQITPIALPLTAVLTLRATPGQMGLLGAMGYAPAVAVGLLAGVWVDRVRCRPVLIAANLGQAIVLALVPMVALLGLLRIELLYAVAFLVGALGVFSGLAFYSILPALVGRSRLVEGNSKLAVSGSVAQIAGPGLAGGLVQLLTAPMAIAIDALSFLVAALCFGRIRTVESAPARPERRAGLWAEIGDGWRLLAGEPLLRAPVASSATLDVFWNALMAVYFLYSTRELGLAPAAIGLIFGLGSVGALLGSLLANRAAGRFGLGPTIVGAQVLLGVGGLGIALAVALPTLALPLLIAAEVVQSLTNTIYNINRVSLGQAITPSRLRGRVNASTRFIGLGAATIGSLLGGVLGERIGLRATMVVGALGGLLAFPWLVFSPLRALHEQPAPVDEPAPITAM